MAQIDTYTHRHRHSHTHSHKRICIYVYPSQSVCFIRAYLSRPTHVSQPPLPVSLPLSLSHSHCLPEPNLKDNWNWKSVKPVFTQKSSSRTQSLALALALAQTRQAEKCAKNGKQASNKAATAATESLSLTHTHIHAGTYLSTGRSIISIICQSPSWNTSFTYPAYFVRFCCGRNLVNCLGSLAVYTIFYPRSLLLLIIVIILVIILAIIATHFSKGFRSRVEL